MGASPACGERRAGIARGCASCQRRPPHAQPQTARTQLRHQAAWRQRDCRHSVQRACRRARHRCFSAAQLRVLAVAHSRAVAPQGERERCRGNDLAVWRGRGRQTADRRHPYRPPPHRGLQPHQHRTGRALHERMRRPRPQQPVGHRRRVERADAQRDAAQGHERPRDAAAALLRPARCAAREHSVRLRRSIGLCSVDHRCAGCGRHRVVVARRACRLSRRDLSGDDRRVAHCGARSRLCHAGEQHRRPHPASDQRTDADRGRPSTRPGLQAVAGDGPQRCRADHRCIGAGTQQPRVHRRHIDHRRPAVARAAQAARCAAMDFK